MIGSYIAAYYYIGITEFAGAGKHRYALILLRNTLSRTLVCGTFQTVIYILHARIGRKISGNKPHSIYFWCCLERGTIFRVSRGARMDISTVLLYMHDD